MAPSLIKRPFLISVLFGGLLLAYFLVTYAFYPGLQLTFSGNIDRETAGHLYWDYGYGFNELDGIQLHLSHSDSPQTENLGNITVCSSGIKNPDSRGYESWLVIPENDYNAKLYSIEGRHHWGEWLTIKASQKGRALALFPGSKVILFNGGADYQLHVFKTPQSGILKVSSQSGSDQYLDGYATNPRWQVTPFLYQDTSGGDVSLLWNPFRQRYEKLFQLPSHRIRGLRFVPDQMNLMRGVTGADSLSIDRKDGGALPVPIRSLLVNGSKVDLQDPRVNTSVDATDGGILMRTADDFVRVRGPIYSCELSLDKAQDVSRIAVTLDGQPITSLQEKTDKQGGVTLYGQGMIRSASNTLAGITVSDATGRNHDLAAQMDSSGTYSWTLPDTLQQSQFNGLLFAVQVVTALVVTVAFYTILTLPVFLQAASWKQLPAAIFWKRGRWIFWLILIVGVTVNLLWLAADWPGCLTPDSIQVNKEIKQLRITNHHPYLYTLFVLGLYNLYDSTVTVLLFQIVSFYVVMAGFNLFLLRQGVSWYLLLFVSMLCFLSIPVNLFNISMWKDIPYTTLLLFWAFFITGVFFIKKNGLTIQILSHNKVFLLAVSFLALCTFRHNGIVYLPVIPILLFFTAVHKKNAIEFLLIFTVLYSISAFVLPDIILEKDNKKNHYNSDVQQRTLRLANRMTGGEKGYYFEQYLGERLTLFVATLGTSPRAIPWYNDMHAPPARWFSVDQLQGKTLIKSRDGYLYRLKNTLLKTCFYDGFTGGRFIYWNSLYSLLLLIISFFLYKWIPVSAFYSFIFLYQAAALFFVLWPVWRYLYFIYVGGYFLLFVVMLEIKCKIK